MPGDWMRWIMKMIPISVSAVLFLVLAFVAGMLWLELRDQRAEFNVYRATVNGEIKLLHCHMFQLQRTAFQASISLQDAVVVANEQGIIMDWSPAATAIFGWNSGEAIGQTILELIVPPDLRAQHSEGFNHLIGSPRTSISHLIENTRALTKHGTEFITDINVYGWKTSDTTWRMNGVFRPKVVG